MCDPTQPFARIRSTGTQLPADRCGWRSNNATVLRAAPLERLIVPVRALGNARTPSDIMEHPLGRRACSGEDCALAMRSGNDNPRRDINSPVHRLFERSALPRCRMRIDLGCGPWRNRRLCSRVMPCLTAVSIDPAVPVSSRWRLAHGRWPIAPLFRTSVRLNGSSHGGDLDDDDRAPRSAPTMRH